MHIISSEGRTAAREGEGTGKQTEENFVDLVTKKENHRKMRCRKVCVSSFL